MAQCCNCSQEDCNWENILSFISTNEAPSHPVGPRPPPDFHPFPPQIPCPCGCIHDLERLMDQDQHKEAQMSCCGPRPSYCGSYSCRVTPCSRPGVAQGSRRSMVRWNPDVSRCCSCEAHDPNMESLSRHSLALYSRKNPTPVHSLSPHPGNTMSQQNIPNMSLCPKISHQPSMIPHSGHNLLQSRGMSHHLMAQTSHSVGLQPGAGTTQPLQVRYNFSRIICSSAQPGFGPVPPLSHASEPGFHPEGEECRGRAPMSLAAAQPTSNLRAAAASSSFCSAAIMQHKHTGLNVASQGIGSVATPPMQGRDLVLLDGERGGSSAHLLRKRTKKPLNAFLLFMREKREDMRKQLGISNSAVVNMALGEKWNKMTSEDQQQYYDQAHFERRLYYERSNPDACEKKRSFRSREVLPSDLDPHLHIHRPEDPQDHMFYIKKPLNAFLLFTRENRASVVERLRITNNATVNEILGQMWKNLSSDAQAKYFEQSNSQRIMHQMQYPEWSTRDNYGKKRRRRKFPETPAENCSNDIDDNNEHLVVDS